MVDDPYKVLEISRDADKEEIKKAYRKMAKKYHPDLHPNDPKAAEKMNEINEAYDMLSNPEKYRQRQQTAGQNSYNGYNRQQSTQSGYGSFGDFDDFFGFGRSYGEPPKPAPEPQDSSDIRQAIDFINMKQYGYASQTLNTVVSSRRNARWFYLSALANNGLGNSILASEQIQKAVEMEPGNQVYRQTQQWLKRAGSTYTESGQEFQKYAEGFNQMCLSFCALQFFCTFCRCC